MGFPLGQESSKKKHTACQPETNRSEQYATGEKQRCIGGRISQFAGIYKRRLTCHVFSLAAFSAGIGGTGRLLSIFARQRGLLNLGSRGPCGGHWLCLADHLEGWCSALGTRLMPLNSPTSNLWPDGHTSSRSGGRTPCSQSLGPAPTHGLRRSVWPELGLRLAKSGFKFIDQDRVFVTLLRRYPPSER